MFCPTEGRGLPESCARIRPGDGLPRFALLQQDEDGHAHSRGQALHLPAVPFSRLHSFARHLSQRHQAPEPAFRPGFRHPEAVRFR